MFDGVQVFVEPLIQYQMINIVLDNGFYLHSLVQSISDRLSDDLFGHKFVAFVPVWIKG